MDLFKSLAGSHRRSLLAGTLGASSGEPMALGLSVALITGLPHQLEVDYVDDAHARCRVRLDLEGGQRTLVLQVECQNRDYIIYSNCADMAEGISRPFPRWVAQPAQVLS